MRAVLIRHGQSTGNIGLPATDLAAIALTALGEQQARAVAAQWTETPSLIVTSPYLRAQQTAAPTTERFPAVPVEVWPIHEFTYLQPSRWNQTRSTERMPFIERYWREADPGYCDGEGAESFETLLRRAEAMLHRLQSQPEHALVYLFSHGQFMQAVRSLVAEPNMPARERMQDFWGRDRPDVIRNGELLQLAFHQAGWHLRHGGGG